MNTQQRYLVLSPEERRALATEAMLSWVRSKTAADVMYCYTCAGPSQVVRYFQMASTGNAARFAWICEYCGDVVVASG